MSAASFQIDGNADVQDADQERLDPPRPFFGQAKHAHAERDAEKPEPPSRHRYLSALRFQCRLVVRTLGFWLRRALAPKAKNSLFEVFIFSAKTKRLDEKEL